MNTLKEELLKLFREDLEFRKEIAKLLAYDIASHISIPLNVATREDIYRLEGVIERLRKEIGNARVELRREIDRIDKRLNSIERMLEHITLSIEDEVREYIS